MTIDIYTETNIDIDMDTIIGIDTVSNFPSRHYTDSNAGTNVGIDNLSLTFSNTYIDSKTDNEINFASLI